MEDYLNRLNQEPGLSARFIGRVAGVEVDSHREATVARLQPFHQKVVEEMGFSWAECWRAEQIHGAEVAVVTGVSESDSARLISGVDGLITNQRGIVLGIYVADCGALSLYDKGTGAIGLLHSGKKGSELGILNNALKMMSSEFGTKPENVIVALSPCIRPPAYEVDFISMIRASALSAGILDENFIDSGVCTSTDLESYYSYRMEKGSTGRMLALLGRSS